MQFLRIIVSIIRHSFLYPYRVSSQKIFLYRNMGIYSRVHSVRALAFYNRSLGFSEENRMCSHRVSPFPQVLLKSDMRSDTLAFPHRIMQREMSLSDLRYICCDFEQVRMQHTLSSELMSMGWILRKKWLSSMRKVTSGSIFLTFRYLPSNGMAERHFLNSSYLLEYYSISDQSSTVLQRMGLLTACGLGGCFYFVYCY